MHVHYLEVGMKDSGFDRVGGPIDAPSTPAPLRGRVQRRLLEREGRFVTRWPYAAEFGSKQICRPTCPGANGDSK